MERYTRVFKFMGQVLKLTGENKVLLLPLLINIAVGMVASLGLSLVMHLISPEQTLGYVILGLGVILLYFVDYFNNGITVSLIYDQITTGKAEFGPAVSNTMRSAPGILVFATISGILDLLVNYAQERGDIVSKIVLRIVYAVWTTATYMVMPTMIIEKTGFFAAFSRSKDIMKNDPTQVGLGVVAIGVVNYVLSIACIGGGYFAMNALAPVSGILSVFVFFFLINCYWGISGYLKITYHTCFYLWTKSCEKEQSTAPELAPAPLAAALA